MAPDHAALLLALDALRDAAAPTWFFDHDWGRLRRAVLVELGQIEDPAAIRKVANDLAKHRFNETKQAVGWIRERARTLVPAPPNLAQQLRAVVCMRAARDGLGREEVLDAIAVAYRHAAEAAGAVL